MLLFNWKSPSNMAKTFYKVYHIFAIDFLHVRGLNWSNEEGVAIKLWISSCLITMNLFMDENGLTPT